MEIKTCTVCHADKAPDDFYLTVNYGKPYRMAQCKACRIEAQGRYQRTHPRKKQIYSAEQHRKWWLSKKYGLTPDDYARMLADQNGTCAICRKPPAAGKRLAVDHNHVTGAVRGLLCTGDNTRLHALENAGFLKAATDYLATHGDSPAY